MNEKKVQITILISLILIDSGLSSFNIPGGNWYLAIPQLGSSLGILLVTLASVLVKKFNTRTMLVMLVLFVFKIGFVFVNFAKIDTYFSNWIFYAFTLNSMFDYFFQLSCVLLNTFFSQDDDG